MKWGGTNISSIRITGLNSRLVVMLIVALLPVFGFVIYTAVKHQDESLFLAGSNLQTVAQLSALKMDRKIDGVRQLLGAVTSGPSLKDDGLAALCVEFLTNIRAIDPIYANMGFLDAKGNLLCDAVRRTPSGNFADRAYFQLALASRSFAIGEYQIGRITGRAVINFAQPVFDNQDALKGVAFAALNLEQLGLALQIAAPPNVSVTLTDRKGMIFATDMSQKDRIGTKFPDATLYRAMKTLPAGITEAIDSNGIARLYSVAAVGGGSQPSLFVVASVTREAVTGPARLELFVALLLFALCATLGLAAARWIGNKTLVMPTRRLLSEMNELAGNKEPRTLETDKTADEIEALSSAFRHLASILKSRQAERDIKEAKLQETQERLLTAQRVGKIGNWEFDVATRRLWWSDQLYAICEQTPESFTVSLKNVANQVFPDDREHCKEAHSNFSAGHTQLDIEYRIVTRTGQVRWVHELGESQADSQADSQGRVALTGTTQDITERVRNERLLASEARALKALSLGLPLKTVLDEFLLGLETILPGGRTLINLVSADGTQLEAGAGPSLPLSFHHALDDLPIGPSAGSRGTAAYRREIVIVSDIETDPLWADYRELGRQHGLRACWSLPVLNPAGKVLATFAVYYRTPQAPAPEDLALAYRAASLIGIAVERDMKDAALLASEQRFRNTFAAAATGMTITSLDGKFLEVNAAYCHMFGYTAQELFGIDIKSFIHPEDRGKYSDEMRALEEGNRDSYISERRFLTKDSRVIWIRSSVSAIRDASEQFVARAAIAEDITLQREAEEALRQSQRLLSMASKLTRQGAWQVKLTDNWATWSKEVFAIHELPLGKAPSAAEGLNFYAPEFRDTIRELYKNCVKTGAPFDAELQVITGKGRRIWVRALGEAVRDPSGDIVQVQGAFQDIDLQKQAELRQRSMENRLATTLENISDAFFLLNHDWNFMFVNGRAESLLKRGRAKLLGQNFRQLFPEAVGTLFEHQCLQAVQKKTTSRFEDYFESLDAWFDVNAHPTEEGLAVYFQDITAKRRTAEQLRLLQTAVSHLNDVVMIADARPVDGSGLNIVFVNDAFERQTGYRQEEVMGKSPGILHGAPAQHTELDRIRAALKKRESVRAELVKYTKAGAAYWVELEIVPIADAGGSLTHFVAIERDITERKQAEDQILQLNAELEDRVERRTRQLEAANRELEAFSYSVSHDLRSPLNTINGFGQLLLKSNGSNLDDKGQHCLRRIRAGAQQMGDLIDGLLSLAKLSRDPLLLEWVDISRIARRVEQECREHEPERQVQVQVQDEMLVQGDAALLSVVVQNLLGNAWKYSARQDAARIDIGSEVEADGQTVYFVRDNGAGFDMAYADKLFGAFQRLHSPVDFAGTGVGLANVKRVVERHGGRVWAEARLNEGATFYFTLAGKTGDAKPTGPGNP